MQIPVILDHVLAFKRPGALGSLVLITTLALYAFHALEGGIAQHAAANDFKGDPSQLQILDKRFGYTAAEVSALFGAWGLQGLELYVLIELIDIFFYMPAYAATFTILTNYIIGGITHLVPALRYLALFPAFLALVDILEDLCQLTVVYSHVVAPESQGFALAVQVASAGNRFKWVTCGTGMVLISLCAVAAGVVKVTGMGRKDD